MNPYLHYLNQGDKVAIVAPARPISKDKIELAEKTLKDWGLIPVKGPNLLGQNNQFSGTISLRSTDLQSMLNNPDIKAILCAGGGYGSIQLIEHLNFELFKKHPKWLIGFSDITVLHAAIRKHTNQQTLHAIMPVKFDDTIESRESVLTLRDALFGKLSGYVFEPHEQNINGTCKGKLIGGNLSILTSLIGTSVDQDYSNCILFIEEVDEYLYHIERMMYSLKLSGKLEQLKGLLVGNITDSHDNKVAFGKTDKQIILDIVNEYDLPVAFDFPAGHENINKAIYLNRNVILDINKDKCSLTFQ